MSSEAPDGVDWQAAYLELESQVEQILRGTARALDRRAAELASARTPAVHGIVTDVRGAALHAVTLADGVDLEYAFVVHRDGVVHQEHAFDRSNTVVVEWWVPGAYTVTATVRSRLVPDTTSDVTSETVHLGGRQ